jgi:NAD(P)-dependent dehydrogenase (short-subunit alcohol dehydrogenase family)
MAGPGRVALVTGASRGIGRGCALHLARAGFDLVIGARTVTEADRGKSRVPGTLEHTASEIREIGQRALITRLDLLDRASLRAAVDAALAEYGRVDVLVNNAVYQPNYGMRSFEDTPIEEYDKSFEGNVLAGLYLIQLLLPTWKQLGAGLVVDVTSGAGQNESSKQPGAGGWPFAYSITKAAFNRVAAGLAKELKQYNIAVVNMEPGFVATERMSITMADQGIDPSNGLPVDVPGSVCAYIASHPTPMAFSGRTVDAPQLSVWANLVDSAVLPHPYGPTNWGYPPFNSIGGAATGVASTTP